MALQDGGGSACIDENAVLDFVQGRLDAAAVARIDEHADGCASCRSAIDEAVRAFRERVTTGIEDADEPTVTRFAAGDKLAGRYRIIRFIARGGMGEVYEAEDEVLGTHIAVKTVAATISDNPLAARRLKQEVNLARRITHPNVCRIFDLGVHQGAERASGVVLFITMELIAGVSLAHRLREGGPFSPAAALPIVRAMAAAIGAAHRAGVVHRDFKSDNVMLASDGHGEGVRVVVMDFGLARGTSLSTHDSLEGRGLAGTLAYMAPEQLDGQRAGQPVDIYALGVVMFEMLAGRLPFVPPPGEPGLSAILNRLSEAAPPLRSLLPNIDARWNDVVARCLEREADRRLASADDVERALADASGDVPAPVGRAEAPAGAIAPAAVAAPSAPSVPPAAQHGGWRKAGYITAGLAGLVAAAMVLRYLPSESTPATSAPAAPAIAPSPPPVPSEAEPRREATVAPPKIAAEATPAAPAAGRAEAASTVDRPPAARRPSAPRPFRRDQAAAAAAPKRATSAPAPPGATPAEPPKPAKPHHRSADPDDGFIFQ